jgi:HEAT repeat protein
MNRTLEESTMHGWVARIEDEDPAVRLASARGAWKVGDEDVIAILLDQLEREEDDEVKVCLAVNALASLGRGEPSREIERRLWPTVLRALRRVELSDEEEQEAARELYRSYRRWGGRRTRQSAFDRLDRYWRE